MDVQENLMEITAKEWGVTQPAMAQEDKMFVGSGDVMTWEGNLQDCNCTCETCKMQD